MATSDAAVSVTLGAANSQFNGVETTTGEGNTEEKRDKDSSSEETSEDEEDDDDETVLKNAGVKLPLSELQGLDKAPLTLLTEFVSCCVGDHFRAAHVLCGHILRLEPDNQVARQFLPILEERLQLDKDLPTESSSEEEEEEEEESGTSSDTDSSANSDSMTTPNDNLSDREATPNGHLSHHSRHCKFH